MTERANKFLWNVHTAFVTKKRIPGSDEDQRFLALALCGEAGELAEVVLALALCTSLGKAANLIKKDWRGDKITALQDKLEDELGDSYAYMRLLALSRDIDLDEVFERRTIPKIKERWPEQSEGADE